ncbi:MAG: ABC transporter ATP-binding protein [Lachnospiraceae bacterium]|nr:ABC transporter ATP-binding protein [Lachnospiraceae bacterium]MBD5511413.1 ABC transporter ATP-binding protein [Lachnospiraceae bacterium]
MNLPDSFIKVIEKYGIDKKDIVFTAAADLDEEFRFADSIIAITNKKLVIARYPYREKCEYRMGGYDSWAMDKKPEEPAAVFYDLEDVEKLEVLRQISTGVLMGKINGTELYLCQFSNTKMEAFMRMSRLLEKTKKGEEITSEDLDVKKGKECCPKCGMIYPDQERKVCPKCMDKKSILLRVMGYFKPYKGKLAVMIFCYLLTAGLNLAWPYLSGTILYDKVLAQDESFLAILNLPAGRFFTALTILVIVMILTKVLLQVLGIIQGVCTAQIATEVMAKLKSQVFDSMGRLSISFFTKRQTGGLMTRVSDDADEISSFFIDGIPYFFINVGTIIATCVIMLVLSPLLAVASIVLMPVLFYISYHLMPRLWHYYGKRHRANRRLNGQMNENFTGARVVKAFGQEEQEIERFKKNNGRVREAELDLARFDCQFSALYYLVEDLLSFLVWAVGSALIISGSNMELGLLITFSGYVGQLKWPLEFMSRIFRWYTNAMNSAQRMFEIIDAVPEVKEAPDPVRPETLRGEIELKNVTFGYEPNKPILKDVSFHVEAGEVLGIVGRSGAGKSTLVNLISRLYDAGEGEVLVDGINVKRYGFKELRKNVAMVSQETYIFVGTVAENIAYARPDASREEIIRAAVQASAHDFICKMPQGYDTILGPANRALSGGEKQRISIARAILANPKILILDEATSAVDTETELAIQKSLEQLEKGRTVLSIAHRLSTLRNATHLIVIDDGRVTESGTHAELMAKKGTFYKLSELQTKALAMRGVEM